MRFDPNRIAIEYYFGDFQYWKLPKLAADALEEGYDGPALRRLAGIMSPVQCEMRDHEIDSAFREMGVDAPISEDKARLVLAIESAHRALTGKSNVFDEATYIRIHLCRLSDPPEVLRRIVSLSKETRNAPRSEWDRIEAELNDAFSRFLESQRAADAERVPY